MTYINIYWLVNLEYAALNRLGISDAKAYCRKRFKDLLYLSSCCVGTNILEQIEASIEEALDSQTWVEILVREFDLDF